MDEAGLVMNELNYVLSSDPEVSYSSSKYLFSLACTNSALFLKCFPEIRIVVLSCCSSSYPQWSVISVLILAISIALNKDQTKIEDFIMDLVELSYEITFAVRSFPGLNSGYYPDLSLLSQTVKRAFLNGNCLTDDLICAIAKHSTIGFLPFASLYEGIGNAIHIAKISVSRSSKIETVFPRILEPIKSEDPSISYFFLTFSCLVLGQLQGDNPSIIRTLSDNISTLIGLSQTNEKFFDITSVFLRFIRSTPSSRTDIKKEIQSKEKTFAASLSVTQKKKVVEAPTETFTTRYIIHRAEASILQITGLFKTKKWVDILFTLLEEAQLLMWSNSKNTNKGGVVLHFKEISEVILKPSEEVESGKKNIIKILSSSQEDIIVSFRSYQDAMQWNNLLRQHVKPK